MRLDGIGGLGVLVGSKEPEGADPGFILTAAHCIKNYNTGGIATLFYPPAWPAKAISLMRRFWQGFGIGATPQSFSMVLGEYCLERFKTHDEQELLASTCIVEPVTDIAVLEKADSQALDAQAEAFEAFCERTDPVPICTTEPEIPEESSGSDEFPVYVFTHHKTWIEGTARLMRHAAKLWVKAPVESGTSGGPVVNDLGELVAVVSQSGRVAGRTTEAPAPRPHRALPIWVWDRIATGSDCRTNIDSPN